jgi:hypothetical protein
MGSWMGDLLISGPLPTQDSTTAEHRRIPMLAAGLEPTILVPERSEAVHVLDRAANGTGVTKVPSGCTSATPVWLMLVISE